jgi:putative solute:sodium symporter small subunit
MHSLTDQHMQVTDKLKEYWRINLRLTGLLMSIWFIATFVIGWFARELQTFTILGFPFPFYMAAQGTLLIFVILVGYYAYRMDKLDREYGVQEDKP